MKKNKSVTAIEWLHEKLATSKLEDMQKNINLWFQKAKEMEKQEIVDAGNSCALKQLIHNEKIDKMTMDEMLEFANTQTVTFGEQYYNETYKGK